MHGCDVETPMTLIDNASRPEQRVVATRLGTLVEDLAAADLDGPALILLRARPAQCRHLCPNPARGDRVMSRRPFIPKVVDRKRPDRVVMLFG